MSTRDKFFAGFTRRYKDIVCPFVGPMAIGNMSEQESQELQAWLQDKKGVARPDRYKLIRLRYIVECSYEPRTSEEDVPQRMFSVEDIPRLMARGLDSAITRYLMAEISKWCGFDEAEIEELAKNLETTSAADSPSA